MTKITKLFLKKRRGIAFNIFAFLVSLVLCGLFLGFFDFLWNDLFFNSNSFYSTQTPSAYNSVILLLWTQGWVWMPAIVFFSLFIGLIVGVIRDKSTGGL